jgi:hypothetical protein
MVAGVDSHPDPKFSDEEVSRAVLDWSVNNNAAITLDVPLKSHKGTIGSLGGVLPERYFEQLKVVAEKVKSAT